LVALSNGGEIGPQAFIAPPPRATGAEAEEAAMPSDGTLTLREHLDTIERHMIVRMLAATANNQSETARRLGISRSSLIDRMKKHGLSGAGSADSP